MNPNRKLPIRALYEINAFARPLTRVDWRTCKQVEATIIKDLDTQYRNIYEKTLSVSSKYEKFATIGRCQMDEINRWTLYGRRKVFIAPREWVARISVPQYVPPMDPHPDVYFRRYKFIIRSANCYFREVNGEWFPVAG
jgi:hypothetical protein